MRDTYPYLRDPRALAEIRKHKWIESQKAGREIGFASAAVDWVKKYGEEWKKIHAAEYKDQAVFIERRKFRRFKLRGAVELRKGNAPILAEPLNLSYFGILCRTHEYLPLGSIVEAHAHFEIGDHKKTLDCDGIVARALPVAPQQYELFLQFNQACLD